MGDSSLESQVELTESNKYDYVLTMTSNIQKSMAANWHRSVGIIFRDNRPVLVRSLLNSGKTVSGNSHSQNPDFTTDSIKLNQVDIDNLNWTIFTSLDGIDAATANLYSDGKNTLNNNLGVIQASDTHRILGYITATRVKFVLILDSCKPLPKEQDIRGFFEKLHHLWAKLCASPFYRQGELITQEKFIKGVDQLLIKL